MPSDRRSPRVFRWTLLHCWCWLPLVLLAAAGCQALSGLQLAGGGASYWMPKLDGHVDSDAPGIPGTKVHVDSDLDLGDEKFPIYHAMLSVGSIPIDVEYLNVGYDGTHALTRSIDFNGQHFDSGTTVSSKLDFERWTAQARFPLSGDANPRKKSPFRTWALAGASHIDGSLEIEGGGTRTRTRIQYWLPLVGLGGAFEMGLAEDMNLFLDGEIAGLPGVIGRFEGLFLDSNARVGLKYGYFKIGGGYRWSDMDAKERSKDTELDLRARGPFVFGEIEFGPAASE